MLASRLPGIPFYVAAPCTTLDPLTPDGKGIRIEERPAEELTHARGERVAALGIGVWNPSFDVTPAALITVRACVCSLGMRWPQGLIYRMCVCD